MRHSTAAKILLITSLLLSHLGFAAPSLFSQDLPPKLVNSKWLHDNLQNPRVRVIDMRSDIRDYWQDHIPGAVYLDSEALRWPDQGGPSIFMPVEAFVQLLGQIGIDEKSTVVAYYEKNGYPPMYLLWALDLIGHKASALLEDGLDNWKREGRPLTQDYPRIKPVKYPRPSKLNTQVIATAEEVAAELGGAMLLLDVRPLDLYSGEKGTWKRKGHIKGARSYFWAVPLNEDGTWKRKEVILSVLERIGVTSDKNIIVYCGQGLMAAHTYFTLKHVLGFPRVRLYDGGFSEWAGRDDLPVETGMK